MADIGGSIQISAALAVDLTHPDKVVYPNTKAHLGAYYAAVSERIPSHQGPSALASPRH